VKRAPPWGAAEGTALGSFSYYWLLVLLLLAEMLYFFDLGLWAVERSDLSQIGGPRGGSPHRLTSMSELLMSQAFVCPKPCVAGSSGVDPESPTRIACDEQKKQSHFKYVFVPSFLGGLAGPTPPNKDNSVLSQ